MSEFMSAAEVAEEAAAKIQEAAARLASVPGMVPPSQLANDDMGDA